MEEIDFELVRPVESHARLVMQWRNDPQTLEMSFHKQPKKWVSFSTEFQNDYFSLADMPPLFALHHGTRVAFLRFRPVVHPYDPHRKICEISINVAPEARGKGLGLSILEAVKQVAVNEEYDDLYAEVKKENEASHKIFTKAGYKKLQDIKKTIPDTNETVTISRYLAELNPKKLSDVFIIAEAGSNWHVGTPIKDKERAFQLIEIAREAGANAVKFQVYRPETVYVTNAGQSEYLSDAGIHEDIQDIFADLAMPYEMIPELAAHCKKHQIEFMATPFSKDDFAATNPYVQRHKIASYEIVHIHLLELAAKSGKPLFLSTGAATEEEINWAVQYYKEKGGKDLTLMQCTAHYPADDNSMNLKTIPWMNHRFRLPVGLSDHSRHPTCAPVAAVALGATAIEKHFTLSNDLPGPDHAFALTPPELKEMIQMIRRTEAMRGSGVKSVLESEKELRSFAHRGIQATKEIQKGDTFAEGVNVDILRPGTQPQGVHPKHIGEFEGKKSKHKIPLGHGVTLNDIA